MVSRHWAVPVCKASVIREQERETIVPAALADSPPREYAMPWALIATVGPHVTAVPECDAKMTMGTDSSRGTSMFSPWAFLLITRLFVTFLDMVFV